MSRNLLFHFKQVAEFTLARPFPTARISRNFTEKIAGKMPGLRRANRPCLEARRGIGFFVAGGLRRAGLEGSCPADTFGKKHRSKDRHYKGRANVLRRADLKVGLYKNKKGARLRRRPLQRHARAAHKYG